MATNVESKDTRAFATFWQWFRRTGIAGQILALIIVMGIFTIGTGGKYLSWANIQVILSLAGIPAILAIGLHQAIILGAIDLSSEGAAGLCIVFVGLLLRNKYNTNDIGLWIIPITLIVGGLSGMLSGLVITKLKIPSFISTLGVGWTLYGLAVYINKATTIPLLDTRIQSIVNGNIAGIPNIALIAVVLLIIVQFIQDHTRFGRYIYAIGGDELLAKQAGINVDKIKIIVFTIAGSFYGLAALFLATRLGSAHPRTGLNLTFPAITAIAVGGVALTGGIGGAKNAALGALIVTALNDGLILMQVNPYIQQAVNGVVLVAAVAVTIDRKKLGFIK
ncbi:amino acid or sugar ABC transport system, permease protein, putative [Candidatus Vecturithrix granuli]|uniref:Autoinducer 2 import system permease protein LsrD n=1 Tax=Vecturithrix granuli TaxID=1499967 RepID=A0A081C2Y7_VECG1|nr:amino acid or sugar ABC transport system, permease protein, putative [Candidatus Vecturithrix granuli]